VLELSAVKYQISCKILKFLVNVYMQCKTHSEIVQFDKGETELKWDIALSAGDTPHSHKVNICNTLNRRTNAFPPPNPPLPITTLASQGFQTAPLLFATFNVII
jgi:hypothetical protein